MKKTVLLLLFVFVVAEIFAATDKKPDGKEQEVRTTRKYQIVVSSLPEESVIHNNYNIDTLKEQSNRSWKELGECIMKS